MKLKDVCEFVYGFPFDSTCFNVEGNGRKLIRIRDVVPGDTKTFTTQEAPECYAVHDGDLLVGMDGDFNVARWHGGDALLNQRVCMFRPDESQLLSGFLQHSLGEILTTIWEKKAFATVKHLLNKDLQAIEIPLPSLEEQRAIVERVEKRLGRVERMEAGFRRMGEWAGKRRQAVLAEAFGESGGGEDGEAEGDEEEEFCPKRPRRSAALPAMCNPGASHALGEGRALSRPPSHGACNSVKGEEGGRAARAPTGWQRVKLGEVLADQPRNGYSSKPVAEATHTKRLTLRATTSGYFKPEAFVYVDDTIPSDSYLWLKSGDLLVQRSNTLDYVGTSCVFDGNEHEFIYPDLMMRMRPKEAADVHFLDYCLKTEEARRFFREKATGAAGNMPKINKTVVCNFPLLLPPLPIQRTIVARIDAMWQACSSLEKLVARGVTWCTHLRRAVLEEAFS